MVSYEQQWHATEDEYATRPDLWRPISRAIGGFDLDPASGAESTPIADQRYTPSDDGLAQSWFGKVFLNPPFSDKDEWYRKAVNELSAENADLVVALAPGDTSTDWFHRWFAKANLHCWLDGRDWYIANGRASFNTVVGVFGDYPDDLVGTLDEKGIVSEPITTTNQQTL